ncbi:hypothetical protein IX51_08215 [uncultured archaeon]|nr:hypothetical protein IX51_08215 [uncultured archaeon]HKJ96968.1 hypothetical protein [Thermoplasmataceae archaeon]
MGNTPEESGVGTVQFGKSGSIIRQDKGSGEWDDGEERIRKALLNAVEDGIIDAACHPLCLRISG